MKKLIYIFSLIAAASFVLASCEKEKTPHEFGPKDVDGCYGVFFPVQEAAGSHAIAPDEATDVTFKIGRINSNGAITVPVVVTASEEGIFDVPSITFADGQEEAEFTVSFANAQIGTSYTLSLGVEDPQYASLYGEAPTHLDFTILREKWNEIGTGLWRDDCLTALFGVSCLEWEVEILENDLTKGLYRVVYPYDGKYGYNDPGDWDESKTYYFEIHAENPDKVWFARQDIGVRWGDYGAMRINSMAGYYLAKGDAASAEGYYGTLVNGVITFPVKAILFSMDNYNDGAQYYGNGSGMFRVCLPGAVLTDYSFKGIETDFTYDGVLPAAFYAGIDVPQIDYVVVSGEITPTQITNQVTAISDGEASNVKSLKNLEKTTYKGNDVVGAAEEITLPATGVYTIVAVSYGYDDDKKLVVSDYGSAVVNYVAAGDEDEMAVDLTCGIGSAAKYAAQGVNTDSSVEVWAYGSDIVDAKIAVVKFVDLVSDMEGVLTSLLASKSISAADIEAINGDGLVYVADKLLPGTEYYTLVWASNGFTEDFFISGNSEYTTGDPLPIYQTYTAGSMFEDGVLENASAWYGDWNYYAVDYYGDTGLREYIGPVTISASETPTEGPDDYGLYDEYVYVDGLFGDLEQFAAYGYPGLDGLLEMDVYGGLMYSCSKTNVAGDLDVHIYAAGAGGWYDYADYYFSAFIPVLDGYYAFVDCSKYASSYNFTGLRILSDYVWNAYIDPLLIDPEKDDNGFAAPAVDAAVARATKLMKESVAEVDNSNVLMNNKARAHAIIDTYKNKQNSVSVSDSFISVNGSCPVKTVEVKSNAASVAPVAATSGNKELRNATRAF